MKLFLVSTLLDQYRLFVLFFSRRIKSVRDDECENGMPSTTTQREME